MKSSLQIKSSFVYSTLVDSRSLLRHARDAFVDYSRNCKGIYAFLKLNTNAGPKTNRNILRRDRTIPNPCMEDDYESAVQGSERPRLTIDHAYMHATQICSRGIYATGSASHAPKPISRLPHTTRNVMKTSSLRHSLAS